MFSEGVVTSAEEGIRLLSADPDQPLPAAFFDSVPASGECIRFGLIFCSDICSCSRDSYCGDKHYVFRWCSVNSSSGSSGDSS